MPHSYDCNLFSDADEVREVDPYAYITGEECPYHDDCVDPVFDSSEPRYYCTTGCPKTCPVLYPYVLHRHGDVI